jgi:hypothetical protein
MDERDAVGVERSNIDSGTFAAWPWRGRNRSVGLFPRDIALKDLHESEKP